MSIFPAKILLATDGSPSAELAAVTATTLARATDSELHVAYIGPWVPPRYIQSQLEADRLKEHARARLSAQVEKVENLGVSVAGDHLRIGEAAAKLADLAEELQADLIVVGSRGQGRMRRALVGSVSDSLVRYAPSPVLVVRGKPITYPARILVASDGSQDSALALQVAADLASKTGSELHLTVVGPGFPLYEIPDNPMVFEEIVKAQRTQAEKVISEEVEKIQQLGVSSVETHLKAGVPAEEITVVAEEVEADLVVVGSRGLNPMKRVLLGGVSDSVVRHAHCPVLVVRRSG